ncbi:MAG: ATP phosphoribosyltransferase regulatory subunit, partial [Nitrospira sp.]|nr:ATP phosphoribosyltransferase regulatory subunit [Nitrospira sp.]
INPNLVRGLDYYTKTAFEVSSENLGSQSAVAAGGRYDGMVKEFGGPATPGIGFAIGMERIIPLIKDSLDKVNGPELYICPMGEAAAEEALLIAEQLRAKGIWVDVNYDNTSIRSQMRKANRIGARNVIVLGEDELGNRKVTIKNMADKLEQVVGLASEELLKILRAD